MTDAILVREIATSDRTEWERLWEGYLAFYGTRLPPEQYDDAFAKLTDGAGRLHGRLAIRNGRAVGLAHVVFHPSTWTAGDYAYLQDLFVEAESRGSGVGRALMRGAGQAARLRGAARLYWLTQERNEGARRLYDRVGERTDFIHYVQRLQARA